MTLEELKQIVNAKSAKRRPYPKEHYIQVACVNWFRQQYPKLALRLFAVPNGGKRTKNEAIRLKAEGVLSGVSDLILLIPNSLFGALLIEMKTEDSSSRQRQSQKIWQQDLTQNGEYKYVVCRSLDDFIKEVKQYLANDTATQSEK